MPRGARLLLGATLLLVAGCSGTTGVTVSTTEQESQVFLQAELTESADASALVDDYAEAAGVGPVRGGGAPSRLLVFMEPDATDQQVREVERRLRAEPGVAQVSVQRGVAPPPLEIEVPGSPPPAQ